MAETVLIIEDGACVLDLAADNLKQAGFKSLPVLGWLRPHYRQPHDAEIEVCVADNGPGIAPEHLPRIFERF